MNSAMKVLAPLSCIALLVAAFYLYKSEGSAKVSRTSPDTSSHVVQTPVAVPQAPAQVNAPAAAVKAQGAQKPAAVADDDDEEGPVTPAESAEFVKRVHEELAKMGIDSYADPNFPANPQGTPEGGIVRDPTPEELKEMNREFAESEKILRNLDRETPHDPPATK